MSGIKLTGEKRIHLIDDGLVGKDTTFSSEKIISLIVPPPNILIT